MTQRCPPAQSKQNASTALTGVVGATESRHSQRPSSWNSVADRSRNPAQNMSLSGNDSPPMAEAAEATPLAAPDKRTLRAP